MKSRDSPGIGQSLQLVRALMVCRCQIGDNVASVRPKTGLSAATLTAMGLNLGVASVLGGGRILVSTQSAAQRAGVKVSPDIAYHLAQVDKKRVLGDSYSYG
jgi:hypothetical protein